MDKMSSEQQQDKKGTNRRLRAVIEEELPDGRKRILREIPLPFKIFSSGSDGFYGNDKIPFDNGERYQTGVTLTRIGSKPKTAEPKQEEKS